MALVAVDALEVEIGYGLTKLADSRVGGDLAERVSATRRQLAVDLGFVMPSVRIRDNATLQPNEYIIKVRGEELARATADADKLLALDSGAVIQPIAGIRTKEPVFSLEAVWIDPKLREMAERSGYTCIEPSAMIGTHLGEVVKQHAAELLTRQDVSRLIENVKEHNEAIVNELVPAVVQIGDIQKVLQHLLREQVPVRDMVTILETMADFAGRVKDSEQLGELVRAAIARTITRQHLDENNTLYCMALDSGLIQQMQASMQQTAGGMILALEPQMQNSILEDLREGYDHCMAEGRTPVVVCPTGIRLALRRMIEASMPSLPVLAYNEVTAQANVEFIGTVGIPAGVAA
jgi:flagellar biosynthesis protein FlhA